MMTCSFEVFQNIYPGTQHHIREGWNPKFVTVLVFCVHNFVPDSPTSLLGCGCSRRFPGSVALELGPVWAGSIFSEEFLVAMHLHSLKFPWKDKADVLLAQLIAEAR
jgi:hypothetical protein